MLLSHVWKNFRMCAMRQKRKCVALRNGLQLAITNSSNTQAIAIRPKAFTNWKNIG